MSPSEDDLCNLGLVEADELVKIWCYRFWGEEPAVLED